MIDLLIGFKYVLWFALILSIVVFIHEFGHYLFARLNNVHVEVFSIGFGQEIIGFTDRNNTRWKISLVPLGGYVKMYGDSDPTSTPDLLKVKNLTSYDRNRTLYYKNLWQKALIVFAGPLFNYLSAIVIIACLLFAYGKPITDSTVTFVAQDSVAANNGIMAGDKILEVDDKKIQSFDEIKKSVIFNVGQPIKLTIDRKGKIINLELTPKVQTTQDAFGNKIELPILGIASDKISIKKLNIFESLKESLHETYSISTGMLKTLGQIITGDRSFKQLGGPVKIAQYSGQSAKFGLFSILWFIALISINLGLVNLFPLPMLDGGHLLYFAIEAIARRPVTIRFQQIATKISFTILIILTLAITYNDIINLLN